MFRFFFTLACDRIFIKTHNTESRCVIELENILFARACVRACIFSPEILRAGAVKGLSRYAQRRFASTTVIMPFFFFLSFSQIQKIASREAISGYSTYHLMGLSCLSCAQSNYYNGCCPIFITRIKVRPFCC